MRIHITKEDKGNTLTGHCPALVSFRLEQVNSESRELCFALLFHHCFMIVSVTPELET